MTIQDHFHLLSTQELKDIDRIYNKSPKRGIRSKWNIINIPGTT